MASEDVQTILRRPADLKDRLVASAAENNRSLSAEVAFRLQESYEVDPKALVSALKGQAAIAQTMAQFVISAVNIAGPQATLTAEVMKLMKEAATQVKTGGKLTNEGPLDDLMALLVALADASEGQDPVEYAKTVLAKRRKDKPKS